MKTIGIDLGGTNVRVAAVDEHGNVLQVLKSPTEIEKGPAHVMSVIKGMISNIENLSEVKGIGLGVPGPVDVKNRVMVLASNLPGFEGYPIAKEIEDEFNIPTFIDNDANVAGLGEAMQGAGRGYDSAYYVTISTGIGGAFVFHNKVVSGQNGHAGEIGNLIIDRARKKINHLNAGAVECEASGTAITRKGQEIFGAEIEHAGHVFAKVDANDPQAIEIIDTMAYDLAVMFSLIAHVCDPSVFIIGGGVMNKSKQYFFEKMKEHYSSLVHPKMRTVQFVEAQLEEPGIVGAASLPLSNS